jgi:hypothetical protein
MDHLWDSIFSILEARCSGVEAWGLDVEEDILELESASFFLKSASILLACPWCNLRFFENLKIYLSISFKCFYTKKHSWLMAHIPMIL